LPIQVKRTILTQQVLRVLLNCSGDLLWEEKATHVNEMMRKVQFSGYNKKFRYEIVNSAMKAYNKIVEEDCKGLKPMYRPRNFQESERKEGKKRKKKSWYEKGGYKSVIFIPSTPQSILKKRYEEEIKKTDIQIKVIEQAGTPLKRILQRSNPFRKDRCDDNECFICKNGGKGNCRRANIKYSIRCKKDGCDNVYNGETSKNAYTRGKEHEMNYRSKADNSHMWKHCVIDHNGEEQIFNMEIDKTFRKDPLLRQITEAIAIEETEENNRMNSRAECRQNRVPRITINTF